MKNNTTTWIIVGVVAVAVIILAVIFGGKRAMPDTNTPVTTAPESTLDTTGDTVAGATGVGTGTAVSLSYQQALVKYADRRLQFNDACQASAPNVVTYKDNSGIMLDNRSNVTRTIKVGTTYTIKPWGFRIIMLPNTTTRVSTYFVDCDNHQNVASIEVQE